VKRKRPQPLLRASGLEAHQSKKQQGVSEKAMLKQQTLVWRGGISQIMPANPAIISEILFLGIVFIWGVTYVVSKNALQEIGPLAYNSLRMALGFLVLAGLAGGAWRRVDKSYLRPTAVTGITLFLAYTLQAYGQQSTTATKAAFLASTSLIYVPLLAALLLRQRPQKAVLAGVGLAFGGLVLLALPSGASMGELMPAPGDMLVALSGFFWALYAVLLARYSPHTAVLPFAALHVGLAAVLSGIGWLWLEPLHLPGQEATAVWLGVFVTGSLILGLGTTAHTLVTRHASAARVALFTTLEPLFGAGAGWLVGEVINTAVVIGGTLILSGVGVAEWGKKLKLLS
jgi:drug/metabolite transporter (DMT)-like permease